MAAKTWFITGVSSGFGREIAQAALAAGDLVVGTARSSKDLSAFADLKPGRAYPIRLDLADEAAIPRAVAEALAAAGTIDVLVNNAGYGHEGLIEESSLDELRRQMEVNFFGAVAVIKAVLPAMRERRRGRIINITSMGGLITFAGLGFYHASKFALEGLSEALGKEVAGFGIHVTAVEPGAFRTDWAGRSMVRAVRAIRDYDALMDPIRERRLAYSGHQIGNPAELARAVVELAMADNPPAHLLLGSDAVKLVGEKLASLSADIEAWRPVSLSTDFPA